MARPRTKNFHFPKYVTVIHGSCWYRPPGAKAIRLGRESDMPEVLEKLRQIDAGARVMDPKQVFALLDRVKANAKNREIEVAITRDDVKELWKRSGGHCEMTGIPFESLRVTKYQRRPWMASIDRIDSSKGYTVDNVRLVCWSVNQAMSNWGEEVFSRMAREYVRHQRLSTSRSFSQNSEARPLESEGLTEPD